MFGDVFYTPADLASAKAEMNNIHSAVMGLSTQASGKISTQLVLRIESFASEVKVINESSSKWSFGTTILEYTERARAASAVGRQLANELAGLLSIVNPVPPLPQPLSSGSIMSTILALAVAGAAGYWLYKWATEKGPEPYPRHLVPQYAGGHRRGGR